MTATAGAAIPQTAPPDRARPHDLLRAAAGPVICAVVLIGLLSAWVATGGAGTLTRIRVQVTLAAVPMRAFTPQASAAVSHATTFLTITNLSGTPDELIGARSPAAGRVELTERDGPAATRTTVAGLVVPARGTLTLTPFGNDLVLIDPAPFENRADVPLTLTFRHAGTVTIQATVTAPGTP